MKIDETWSAVFLRVEAFSMEVEASGDWYLYQNHTEIRIYGCQLAPYKLPKYLPMRLFSLEYYRQIMNSDEINFVSAKKRSQFKVKN